jgi:hypothetical protein
LGLPAATGPQTPLLPEPFAAAVHAWQRPVQAVLQQTPETQKPEAQSLPVVQGPPSPAGTVHVPLLHV